MEIDEVSEKYFPDWLRMRRTLYAGVDGALHEEEMTSITISNDLCCFIAQDSEQKVIGFVELSLRNIVDGVAGGPVGYIEGLYLEPEFRNKGYGGMLISKAIAWFKDKGCKHMGTDAEIENKGAQKYYEKLGFERKWTIVQYLKDIS